MAQLKLERIFYMAMDEHGDGSEDEQIRRPMLILIPETHSGRTILSQHNASAIPKLFPRVCYGSSE